MDEDPEGGTILPEAGTTIPEAVADGGGGRQEGPPAADLHLHTTASDGTLTVDRLPEAARRAGVSCVAVTDHDVIHPDLDAPVCVRDGVTVVRGIELRAEADSTRIDLLGYAVDPTPELRAELDRIQRDRVERGRRIVECVENYLGVDLDADPAPGFGRPHVARAVAESEAPYDVERTFAELIGSDGPCYVPREVTPFDRAVELLRSSCPVVALAHPFRYPDPASALELTAELDAVERYYPYGRSVDHELVDRAIADRDLLATGGSDAHDAVLGRAGPPREPFERFRERLREAES